ncbi:hypothetical protein GDO81_021676 [Engystomops pustulosus]|uniref:TIL domain-containing protein n=2 Tax=Engystomops pustulosus TaxID=76066 RepID=A0AAV6YS92_ENGPU|nr:hypothetical protein GDO81_021676 [Engystomops pustulosus]
MWKLSAILLISTSVLHVIDAIKYYPPVDLPVHNCPDNQKWVTCGPACPTNCENYQVSTFRLCKRKCEEGCFCIFPYIFLAGDSGPCVLPEDCPKKPNDPRFPTFDLEK